MVFSSVTFLFAFLPVTLIVYVLLKGRVRDAWLLVASLLFYAWGGPAFLPIMLVSICLNYFGGLFLDILQSPRARGICLFFVVSGNLLLLGYWKYFNFFVSIIEDLTGQPLGLPAVTLPIGISFFTFQGMSYVIDCYRKQVAVQRNPLYVALYIAMFPQLIAGPIVRYTDIEAQLQCRTLSIDRFAAGIRRFAVGLAKKAILANAMAVPADTIFGFAPAQNTPGVAWLGIITYCLQIYYDFSGYSDMAIGMGMMMGFTFPENFNYPWISHSLSEFWVRWHITLGTWFREYVYFPLGGSRRSRPRVIFNMFVVWFLTGFWHGASWNFIAWGLSLFIFITLESYFLRPAARRLSSRSAGWRYAVRILGHCYFLFLMPLTIVFFRAPSLTHAVDYLRAMFGLIPLENVRLTAAWYCDRFTVTLMLISIFGLTPAPLMLFRKSASLLPEGARIWYRNGAALILLAVSVLFVVTSTYNPFIYFQF